MTRPIVVRMPDEMYSELQAEVARRMLASRTRITLSDLVREAILRGILTGPAPVQQKESEAQK